MNQIHYMTIIFKIACTIAIALNAFRAFLYNAHMFQLNGYKNSEHLKWLFKNYKRQRFALSYLIVFLLLFILYNKFYSFGLGTLILILPFAGYDLLIKGNTKKKLVFTPRMIRLAVTNLVLALAIALAFEFTVKEGTAISVLVLLFEPLILVLSNCINAPVENGVKGHYINDAKRILEDNKNLTVIGVTGSYGKTSLKFYLKTLLESSFNVVATPESYNTPMGVVRTIREQLKPTTEIFICEMGARHVGDIKEICDIVHPDLGVITAVGPQHLETFGSIENVRKTKFELADALPENAPLYLNGDSNQIRKDNRPFNKIYYGVDSMDGYYAENIRLTATGTDFEVVAPDGEREQFHTHLLGDINVLNVLGAIAVAHGFKIPLSDLKVPVRRIKPVPHRMELKEYNGFTIIDDAFNSNPVGSKAAVETLKMFDGARILVTPGMVELGADEEQLHYRFGMYAADCADYVILVNKYRTESIKKGLLDYGFDKDRLFEFDKFKEAIQKAYDIKDDRHKYILLENDLPDNY